MIEPQRIGRFLVVDESGHVRPDVADANVDDTWKPLVAFVTHSLMARPGVRSVYLRGSIPRGLAIENVSDADFIYFSEQSFDAADFDLRERANANFPFVKDVEILRLDRVGFGRVHRPQQRPYFHMLVKTQCLFLAGDDVARHIAPFKLGPEMVSHVFSLASEFATLQVRLREGRHAGGEHIVSQWFSRRVVRSGLEVTMDRCDRFTRDLYLCYEQFAAFYPRRSEQMYRVLINCLNGRECFTQFEDLVMFLADEGRRLHAG